MLEKFKVVHHEICLTESPLTLFFFLVDLAETKYTSLRTYFVKQRRKVKESQKNGCGPGTVYRPSWPPYSSLTFLEKTLDLQNNADMMMSDSSIALSMVGNPRTGLPDNMGLVTMADPCVPGSPVGRASVNGVRSPVPEVNTIILSMPDKSESPSPSSSTSPLPETTMRIPMPEGLRLPIKMEDKEPTLNSEDFQEFSRVRHVDESPSISSSSRSENAPSSHSPPHALSTRSSYSVFPLLPTSATSQPAPTSSVSSSSISCLPASHSSLPYSFPHSITSALPSSSVPPPGKSRKRNLPKDDGSQIGVILQDAVESLRTITGNCREDANDDVGGFLKMTGYQLRSIQDPIRRMRVMHTIQGYILAELSSPFSKQTDETAVQKVSETDAFT